MVFLLKKSILNLSQLIKGSYAKQAMKLLDKSESELYFSIEQSLQFYFESKWNMGRSQFNKEFIKDTLQITKVDNDVITEISDLLEICEMARFTNKRSDESDKEALVRKTKSILQKLENY